MLLKSYIKNEANFREEIQDLCAKNILSVRYIIR